MNKVGFRNALARLITRLKLKHTIVEYEEFKALCLSLNWQCEKVLLRSHSSIPRRIAANFEYQRSLVKQAIFEGISCVHLATDTWTSGLQYQKEFQAINAQ